MIKATVIHPSGLTAEDRRAWRDWMPYANPLLGPGFAALMGDLRPDARVALIDLDGERAGFLAFHARHGGVARPIGAPFSDYHGAAIRPGAVLSTETVLRAAGIVAYRFTASVDRLLTGAEGPAGYVIQGGGEGYLAGLDAKRMKNWRRLNNKIEREIGPISLEMDDRDVGRFGQLLLWKRRQLRQSGLHDFLAPRWSQTMMRTVFDCPKDTLRGRMMTLSAGGRLLAGHFGVEEDGVCHSWISSINPEAGACSPGQVLLARLIGAMPEAGLKGVDLGPSHAHYKAPFCTTSVTTAQGTAVAATTAGRLVGAAEQAWSLAERAAPACAAARRRFDHIAALELSAAGRLRGVLGALADRARRPRQGLSAEA
jgi:CelD/BcsL family acetyltransferase involved in cellulose biosynthesis